MREIWTEGSNNLSGDLLKEEKKHEFSEWYKRRKENVLSSVSAHDVLRHFGIHLKSSDAAREEQISCPFHGKDEKPSARVFPSGPRSNSGVWCWTCQKRWDVIGLWKEFSQNPEMKFGTVLFELERAFSIVPPEPPQGGYDSAEPSGPSAAEVKAQRLLEACENRLREERHHFTMTAFMTFGQVLDRLRHHLDNQLVTPDQAVYHLGKVLDKIGERVRGETG